MTGKERLKGCLLAFLLALVLVLFFLGILVVNDFQELKQHGVK